MRTSGSGSERNEAHKHGDKKERLREADEASEHTAELCQVTQKSRCRLWPRRVQDGQNVAQVTVLRRNEKVAFLRNKTQEKARSSAPAKRTASSCPAAEVVDWRGTERKYLALIFPSASSELSCLAGVVSCGKLERCQYTLVPRLRLNPGCSLLCVVPRIGVGVSTAYSALG